MHDDTPRGLIGAIAQVAGLLDNGPAPSISGIICLTQSAKDENDRTQVYSTFKAKPMDMARMIYHLLKFVVGMPEDRASEIAAEVADVVSESPTGTSKIEREIMEQFLALELRSLENLADGPAIGDDTEDGFEEGP